MRAFHKPTIVVSKCLEFEPVRYNGQVIPDPFVRKLIPMVDFIPVCPEVEIGLGIPRKPVRVVLQDGEMRLIQPGTGLDVTDKMQTFSHNFLSDLPPADGFILKSRSPSSGIKDVKYYPGLEKVAAVEKGPGFFGGAVLKRFPHLAVEDEGRLTNFAIRETFLTRVFAWADFRAARKMGRMRDLVDFHSRHKYLLMAFNQKRLKELGRITANADRRDPDQVFADYEAVLGPAFSTPLRRSSIINVTMHMQGYFSKGLTAREKKYFAEALQKYRDGNLPLSAVLTLLRSWSARYEEEYLEAQTFFEPFPDDLILTRDSGKGIEG